MVATQQVGVIHEHDRVIDDDAEQHDDAEERLLIEGRVGDQQDQDDADGG